MCEEQRIKRNAQDEGAIAVLLAQLEYEIAGHAFKLGMMIEHLEGAADKRQATARALLLICYIKRCCTLFFRKRETDTIPADELRRYIEELAEIAACAGVGAIVTGETGSDIDLRQAEALYSFMHNVMNWATLSEDVKMLVHLEAGSNGITLKILSNESADSFQIDENIMSEVALADGSYLVKDLDTGAGISLSFPVSASIANKDNIGECAFVGLERVTKLARLRTHEVLGERFTMLMRNLRYEDVHDYVALRNQSRGLIGGLQSA